MNSGFRTTAEDGLEMQDGPSSMISTEVEGQPPVMGGGEDQGQEPKVPASPSNTNNNHIDPAILKAMDPHNGKKLC